MILKRIFIAIYLKSVFPPYDSNIKFYNSTLYSTKNVEIKTSFYQKWLNPIRAGGVSYMTPPSVFLPSF